MPVGDFFQYTSAQPLSEFYHPFGVTRRAKMTALAGKRKQIFMVALSAFDAGKAVMKDSAVKILIYYLFYMRP